MSHPALRDLPASPPPLERRTGRRVVALLTAALLMVLGLLTSAAPLPQVPNESQYETSVGTAIKGLFTDAASGRPVTTDSVKAALTKAQQQMPKS